MTDDITFCATKCNCINCFRHPSNIKNPSIPHSFAYLKDAEDCPMKKNIKREFIEIITNYPPDDLCTYPEYRGKPYYSIHYRENGEEFVGFGTYKIEVLSRYLQDYFFGADMRGNENEKNN